MTRQTIRKAALSIEGSELRKKKTTIGSIQNRRPARAALGWVLIAGILLIATGCSGDVSEGNVAHAKRPAAAIPVTVARAVQKSMPVELQAVGTADAYSTVAVKAQVEGELTAVHLQEGQCVHAGDLLFNIDPRPFQVRLKQVQADLARDKAQLVNAHALLERNAAVVTKGYVSQEQYDQAAANETALEATVQADAAAVENAQIQLSYCAIRSPITGCAGEVFVDRGNLVKANDADHPLVVIRQMRPIYVGFSVPERYLPEIRKYSTKGKLIVKAAVGHGDVPLQGVLDFVDNSVNTATGTILLKATFANPDLSLWPGQFVQVTLQLASQEGAVVIPAQAVQSGQQGQYVFIMKPDKTVDLRSVRIDRTVVGQAVITQGVQAGEAVVTDGQLRLFPGAAVKVVADLKDQGGAPQP
jgi:multidrug efflux system membrane fusion protein